MTTLSQLAAMSGGEVSGGNVIIGIGDDRKMLGTTKEGIFCLTPDGEAFLMAANSRAIEGEVVRQPKPRAKKIEPAADELSELAQGLDQY